MSNLSGLSGFRGIGPGLLPNSPSGPGSVFITISPGGATNVPANPMVVPGDSAPPVILAVPDTQPLNPSPISGAVDPINVITLNSGKPNVISILGNNLITDTDYLPVAINVDDYKAPMGIGWVADLHNPHPAAVSILGLVTQIIGLILPGTVGNVISAIPSLANGVTAIATDLYQPRSGGFNPSAATSSTRYFIKPGAASGLFNKYKDLTLDGTDGTFTNVGLVINPTTDFTVYGSFTQTAISGDNLTCTLTINRIEIAAGAITSPGTLFWSCPLKSIIETANILYWGPHDDDPTVIMPRYTWIAQKATAGVPTFTTPVFASYQMGVPDASNQYTALTVASGYLPTNVGQILVIGGCSITWSRWVNKEYNHPPEDV